MIPILYDKNETSFTSNGIGALSDASSCIATEERNGVFELEMTYPTWGVHFDEMEVDCFIKARTSAKTKQQLFRIYSITKPINRKCVIRAQHVSYQMLHIPLLPFSAAGAAAVMAAIPSHIIGDNPFTFYTDNPSTRVYSLYYPKSLRGALQGDQWSIMQNYGGDYEFDNFDVKLLVHRGEDKGVSLEYGKNIIDLRQEQNIQQTYTGIVPYWYGSDGVGDEELVMLSEVVLWADTAANFPYSRALCVDFTDQMDGKPTEQELRDAAELYIDKNDIGHPAVSISLDFVDLSQTEEYKSIGIETINLCDTITVKFTEIGINQKARVTRTKYDVLSERYTNLYIGEQYHSIASIIADQTVVTQENQIITGSKIAESISSLIKHYDDSALGDITIPNTGYYRIYKPSSVVGKMILSVEVLTWTSNTGSFNVITMNDNNSNAYVVGEPGVQIKGLTLRWIYI